MLLHRFGELKNRRITRLGDRVHFIFQTAYPVGVNSYLDQGHSRSRGKFTKGELLLLWYDAIVYF